MKKLLVIVFSLSVCLIFLLASDFEFDLPEHVTDRYDKYPHDDVDDLVENFKRIRFNTTLGRLARYSDIIAIGRVEESDWTTMIIKIEIPFIGCTNGQSFYINSEVGDKNVGVSIMGSQIMFCAYTNQYEDAKAGFIDWSSTLKTNEHTKIFTIYQFENNVRSEWNLLLSSKPVHEQFTNILQAVRFDRNWTNFFYLCRDGLENAHPRVARDSLYDLCGLIKFASTNEARFIYNDPLVSPEAKAYLLERHPYVEEEEEE